MLQKKKCECNKQYVSYLLVEHRNTLMLELTLIVAFVVSGGVEHS